MATDNAPGQARVLRTVVAAQWVLIGALVVAGFTLDGLGHSGLSWAADGVALAVYGAARLARARLGRSRDRSHRLPQGPPGRTHGGDT